MAFTSDEPKPELPPKPRPSRAAQMLALAHEFQRLINDGEVPNHAALAAQVGLTRAHVTQILDLLLAPDIQESVLLGEDTAVAERRLRGISRLLSWDRQRRAVSRT